MSSPLSSHRTPTRRRVVGVYVVLAVAVVAGLIALTEALRHDHPAAGPVTPEMADEVDPLREDVICELAPPREGEVRPQVLIQPALPEAVSSNQLYDCPGSWDGIRVRYTGEVVGALLDRGDHVWAQLNDDVYANGSGPLPTHRDFRGGNAGVGALLRPDQAAAISRVGGPTQRGDLVEVTARFRRVEPTTHEIAILEVESLTVLRQGSAFTTPPVGARSVVAGIAAAAALLVVLIERRRRGA